MKSSVVRKSIWVFLAAFLVGAVAIWGARQFTLVDSLPDNQDNTTVITMQDMAQALDKLHAYREEYPYETVTGSYLAGRFASDQGDVQKASEYLKKALYRDPNNPYLIQLGLPVFIAAGDMPAAIALAKRVDEQEGVDSHLGMVILIAEALKNKKYDNVQEYMNGFSDHGFGQYLKPLMSAWVLVAQDKADEGAKLLMQQVLTQPGLAVLYYTHLALLYDYSGQYDKAEDMYEKALDQQFSVRMVSLTGHFYERQGKYEKARDLYNRAAEELPNTTFSHVALDRLEKQQKPGPNITTPLAGMTMALFDLGSILEQEGATRLALLFSKIAAYISPEEEFINVLLGDIFVDMERYQEAVAYYKKISNKSDLYIIAQIRIADAYETSGDIGRSIDILQDLKTGGEDWNAHLTLKLANIYRRDEQFMKAIALYSELIAKDQNGYDVGWAVYYGRGICYEQTNQWQKAEEDLLKALEIEPDQPMVLNYLGYTWADKGMHIETALDYIRKAVSLRPNDGYIIDSMGWVLYRLGEYQKAIDYLEQAVTLVPNDPVINDHLGDAYWKADRQLEARFQWNRALQNTNDAEMIAAIELKLLKGPDQTQAIRQSAKVDTQDMTATEE